MRRRRGTLSTAAVAVTAATAMLGAADSAAAQQGRDLSHLSLLAPRIDDLVGPQAEAGLFSGLILVARDGQILFEGGWGHESWESGTPTSSSTRFGIASISKGMTGIVVRLLEGRGRLDLDSPVEQFLPGFPRGPEGGSPTLQHLLEHRAGVPHRVTDALSESQHLDAEAVVERVKAGGLLFEPGASRLYSSAGYTCLARVVEIVEGKPFAAVLRELIFEPAGMSSAMSETGEGLMPHRAVPHRLGTADGRLVVKKAPFKDLRFLTGAGSVYATGRDLLQLARAIEAGVFGATVRDDLFGPDAQAWRSWAGRTNGYESWLDVQPATGLVLVFLSNLQSAANWQLREQIRNVLADQPTQPVPLPPAVAPAFEDPHSLVGTFGPAEIAVVDGSLFRGDNEFYPTEGARYYIAASGTAMRFRRDATGGVDALISLGDGGEERILPRSR